MAEQPDKTGSPGTAGTPPEGTTPAEDAPTKAQPVNVQEIFGEGYGKGIKKRTKEFLAVVQKFIPEATSDNLDEVLNAHFTRKPDEEDEAQQKSDEKLKKSNEQKDVLIKELQESKKQELKAAYEELKRVIITNRLLAAAGGLHDPEDVIATFQRHHRIEVEDSTYKATVTTLNGESIIHKEGEKAGKEMSLEEAFKAWTQTKPQYQEASQSLQAGSGIQSSDAGAADIRTFSRREIGKMSTAEFREKEAEIDKARKAGKIVD